MKQVWQTEDGVVFAAKQDAEEWEAHCNFIEAITKKVWEKTSGITHADIREVLDVVIEHYNVTPK
jgi:hypothetical protein